MNFLSLALAAIIVGTWNGQWFPSGRAKHRAHPKVEAATIATAAEMFKSAISRLDPHGTNDIILCLNEIRDPATASNLVAGIGREGLTVAIVSRYRWRDRFNTQQDVIATTLPIVKANWCKWKNEREFTPPRGYAFASVIVKPAVTADVYAVHLKSNYGANTVEEKESNREKRARSIKQIIERGKPHRGEKRRPVIVAGDFNADCWRKEFSEEKIFDMLEKAGYFNTLSLLPDGERGTHPSRKWGDSTLDYVMIRGFECISQPLIPVNDDLSDHRAVFAVLH